MSKSRHPLELLNDTRSDLEAEHVFLAISGASEHLSPFVHCNNLSPSTLPVWPGLPVREENNHLGDRVASQRLW